MPDLDMPAAVPHLMGNANCSHEALPEADREAADGDECEKAENEIAADPTAWPVIKGSGGVRKARFGRDDLGKSGGGRIGYVFWEAYDTLYLLAAYPHNEKDDFSKAECDAFKKLVKSLLKVKRDEAAKRKQTKRR